MTVPRHLVFEEAPFVDLLTSTMAPCYGTAGGGERRKHPSQRRRRDGFIPWSTSAIAGAVVFGCCLLALGGSMRRGGAREATELVFSPDGDPTVWDALNEANANKHLFKDPRAGSSNSWSNNYPGMKAPIKNWNPLGEDMVGSLPLKWQHLSAHPPIRLSSVTVIVCQLLPRV